MNSINTPILTILVVAYKPNHIILRRSLLSISHAMDNIRITMMVVDHSPTPELEPDSDILQGLNFPIKVVSDPHNPGFGAGHNRQLSALAHQRYHLILNPDLEVAPDALKKALEFMEQHQDCGLLTPFATWEGGEVQRLCKRYPTVFDLLLRGFAPAFVKQIFQSRLAKYEMADQLNNHDVLWNPPIVSGCFMLFRTDVLQQLGGFDPRFFLYFEDFDISLRAGKISRIAYVPQVKVVHHGGHASRKGWRHIWMFGRSMATFFNIHGWRWW
ncbi:MULTISPECIES: glycosyltransferase [unclassified Aeromonas]|uniref:glycosyltransferase n=1 Tax=unclassified Aeromonas TaxID=257493 RepID=UPI0022DF58F6|nr:MULTISPECIES: glycosyltransferase [unclassified Aeromonas]